MIKEVRLVNGKKCKLNIRDSSNSINYVMAQALNEGYEMRHIPGHDGIGFIGLYKKGDKRHPSAGIISFDDELGLRYGIIENPEKLNI